MTGYFPRLRPDELLYSVLARYARHLGYEGCDVAHRLFGDRTVVAVADLPTKLDALWQRLPAGIAETTADLVDRGTLLPYYVSFRAPAEGRAIRRLMMGSAAGLHLRLGLAASPTERIRVLRYCPFCNEDALRTGGETYWHRVHQVPGVLMCPQHAVALRQSTVDLSCSPRHAYVAAQSVTCPVGLLQACFEPTVAAHLLAIAQASARLFEAPPAFDATASGYRVALANVGLMRSAMKVDQRALRAEFEAYYSRTLALLPGVVGDDGHCGAWLESIVRTQRHAFQPLHHLLLQRFLGERAAVDPPFGHGPWRCENPLAPHYGRDVVPTADVSRDGDALTGEFACSCGYVYTRRLFKDGRLGPRRLKIYGPMLEPALRRLLKPKATRRGVAGKLALDAKTLLREIAKLGLICPWSGTEGSASSGRSSKSTRIASPRSGGRSKRRRRRKVPPARRDWPLLDAATVEQLEAARREILTQAPPRRASISALERATLGANGLRRRRAKLPRSWAALVKLAEGREAYRERLRRLARAAQQGATRRRAA